MINLKAAEKAASESHLRVGLVVAPGLSRSGTAARSRPLESWLGCPGRALQGRRRAIMIADSERRSAGAQRRALTEPQ
jgi:hypothetical protein